MLTGGTGHLLLRPVNDKTRPIESLAGAGLPARIISDGSQQLDAIPLLAVEQCLGIRVALVDQMFGRQQILLRQ